MKKTAIFILLIFGLCTAVWAQEMGRGRNHRGWAHPDRSRLPASETVTVSGRLIVAHGMPAIKSGDITYLVCRISRLTGFIDGLKEGAQVTIDGIAMTSPQNSNLKFLVPANLTLYGRIYDLASPAPSFHRR